MHPRDRSIEPTPTAYSKIMVFSLCFGVFLAVWILIALAGYGAAHLLGLVP